MNKSFTTLPKEFWLSNDEAKFCHACEKSFTAVSRKNHCRYCGLIFCNKCTTRFIKADPNSFPSKICENCFKTLKLNNDSTKSLKLSITGSFASDLDQSFEFDQNILDLFQEIQPNIHRSIEESIKAFAENLALTSIKKLGIDPKWAESLISTAFQVVETVCPSVKYRHDKMSVNSYVRILEVADDLEDSRFISGGIISKNIANRKMPKFCESPKILFLDNREKESLIYRIVNVISEESKLDNIFVKKINAICPNVIITTAGLSEKILQRLVENNISAFLNVPIKEFNHLARTTNAVILNTINEGYFLSNYLGRCRRMNSDYIGKKQYIYFSDIDDYTLAGTVVLQGNNLKNVKKALKILITGLRNAKLESILMLCCGCKIGKQILIEQYYEEITFNTIQICKEYICKNLYKSSVNIYTASDMTLGSFLIHLISMKDELCAKCGNYSMNHTTYYFYKQKVLKYCMHKVKSINEDDYFFNICCVQCHKGIAPHYLSNAIWEYSLNKFIWNFFSDSTAAASCGHPLFGNTFIFQKGNTQIFFQCEEFKIYELSKIKIADFPHGFFNQLLKESLDGFKNGSKYVIEHLIIQVNNIIDVIKNELEFSKENTEKWLSALKDAENISLKLIKLMKNICYPAFTTFTCYLQVESIRRLFFLEFSNLITDLDSLEKSIKKIKPTKKNSILIHSLKLSTISNINDLSVLHEDEYNSIISKLTSGILTLNLGNGIYVPVYENDAGSMIAHTLSSFSYNSDIIDSIGTNFKDFILDSDSTEWENSAISYSNLNLKEENKRFYGDNIYLTTTFYFPKQFHCLRSARQIPNNQFILSMSRTVSKTEDVGKSSALFKQTHDFRFILKIVDEKELKMFNLMAVNYFSHLYKCLYEKIDSALNFCLGIYKIAWKNLNSGKSKTEYVMVFEKIGYGISPPLVVYDLKGTTNKRRRVKEGDKKTKMDLNFVEDFGGLPLPLAVEDWDKIKRSIINDSGFLSKSNIIDYSMLLVMNKETKKLALSIIDYMQQYTIDKAIECKYKTVISSQAPTILGPENYKNRFCEQILNHYLIQIDD